MILICGIPSEPPLQLVINALEAMNIPVAVFNQRHFSKANIKWTWQRGKISGIFRIDSNSYPLEQFSGVYARLTDENTLPEMQQSVITSSLKLHSRRLHTALINWMEITPARVVNRSQAMLSNASKPYQLQLIRQAGFDIPETLITNDPGLVNAFRKKHGTIIYKSISGVRSIVKKFGLEDEDKLERIRWCPVQFQEWIDGYDVRVHVIGEKTFATRIISRATDYRYAGKENKTARLKPFEIPAAIKGQCIRLTQTLGLAFSGIDLRFTGEGRVVCFEVNPSPGYSYYEEQTEQPISKAVAEYLAYGY